VGYELQAVIGGSELLRARVGGLPAARWGVLRQGLAILAITDDLFDGVTGGSGPALGFWRLPGGLKRVLASWSREGPLAYVEAEFFGGVGMQRAAVWAGGGLVWGPLGVEEDEPFPAAGSPISQALRRLGVQRGDAEDEFAAVGLHQHRHTADWIADERGRCRGAVASAQASSQREDVRLESLDP
jgi:hypothetical protein